MAGKNAVALTYKQNRIEKCRTLSISVPDQMVTMKEFQTKGGSVSKKLSDSFAFLAVTDGDSFDNYMSAAVSFNIKSAIGESEAFEKMWNPPGNIKVDISSNLLNWLENSMKKAGYENCVPVLLKNNKSRKLAIAFAHTGEGTRNDMWRSFAILILHKNCLYQGTAFFNGNDTRIQNEKMLVNWLSGIGKTGEKETFEKNIETAVLDAVEMPQNMRDMRSFVRQFKKKLYNAIIESNQEIIGDTPITRKNDRRIRLQDENTKNVVISYAYTLQEVMKKLDTLGEKQRVSSLGGKKVEETALLIIECADKLDIHITVPIHKEDKEYSYHSDSEYLELKEKWQKIYNDLPSVKAEAERIAKERKQARLDSIKSEITRLKTRKSILEKRTKGYKNQIDELESKNKTIERSITRLENAGQNNDIINSKKLDELTEETMLLDAKVMALKKVIYITKEEQNRAVSEINRKIEQYTGKMVNLTAQRKQIIIEEASAKIKAEKGILHKKSKLHDYEMLVKQHSELDDLISSFDDAIHELMKEKNQVADNTKKELDDLNQEISSFTAQKTDADKRISEIRRETKDTSRMLDDYREEIKENNDTLEGTSSELKDAVDEMNEIDQRLKDLETEKSQLTKK